MRLVVHIGAAEAASGLLQRAVFLNESRLAASGLHVPKAGRLDQSYELAAHHNLGWELLGDGSFSAGRGTWADLAAELATVDAGTVLLTSETFGRVAAAPRTRHELVSRLRRLSDDVTVVYVVREPLAWVNSLFVRAVTALGEPRSFEDYASDAVKSGHCDLAETLRFWYDSGPARFLALRYDELMAAGPLDHLLDALGFPPYGEELELPDESRMRTPGPVAVDVLRALSAQLRVVDPRFSRRSPAATRIAEAAQRRAAKLGWYDDTYWGWTPKLARWAAGRLEASHAAFASAVWGSDWPMPLPVDRAEQAANLIESDRLLFGDVSAYLSAMTSRYLKLAGEGSAEEVVDATTAPADEAERAVRAPARRAAASV